jgi:hypothetical protein
MHLAFPALFLSTCGLGYKLPVQSTPAIRPLAVKPARARFTLFSLFAITWSVAACASTQPPRSEAQTHRAFADIQQHEARVEDAAQHVRAGEPCPAPCERSQVACGEADAVCSLAHDLADNDALLRCQRVRTQCDQLRASSQSQCSCAVK